MYRVLTLIILSAGLMACGNTTHVVVRDGEGTSIALPADPSVKTQGQVYTVQPGDTLYSIAWNFSLDYRDLAAINNIPVPYILESGQKLRLSGSLSGASNQPVATESNGVEVYAVGAPAFVETPVATTETPPAAAEPAPAASVIVAQTTTSPNSSSTAAPAPVVQTSQTTNTTAAPQQTKTTPPANETKPVAATSTATPAATSSSTAATAATPAPAAAKPKAAPAVTNAPVTKWVWPANGRVTRGFSGNYKGIDIEGPRGEPIHATAAGQVVYSGTGLRGYGQLIIIKHNTEFLSAYAHNSVVLVAEGDTVKQGQKIAEMGDSGTNKVKLHFELRLRGKPVDPQKYLPRR